MRQCFFTQNKYFKHSSYSSNTGYYCNPEGGVFACMDWTFGAQKMMEQEEAFNQRV